MGEILHDARDFHALVRGLRKAADEARQRAAKASDVTRSHIRDSERLIREIREHLEAQRERR